MEHFLCTQALELYVKTICRALLSPSFSANFNAALCICLRIAKSAFSSIATVIVPSNMAAARRKYPSKYPHAQDLYYIFPLVQ